MYEAWGAFVVEQTTAVVAPIRPQAMPVILTTTEEIDIWMNAPGEEGLAS